MKRLIKGCFQTTILWTK